MTDRLEAYVREADLTRVVRWGEELLGELVLVESEPDEVVRHDRSGREFSLTPSIGGTDFTAIVISPAHDGIPFATDVDFARAAHRAFGVEARCEPGSLAPGAAWSQLWSVSGNGERLIEWWTPANIAHLTDLAGPQSKIGLTFRDELFDEIEARYAEPHREYHTALHVSEAYGVLKELASKVERWDEMQIALWFHDAIYDTRRHDNEERSADWARDELLAAGAQPDAAARVHALVLATKHRDEPEGNDARLLVDADLSILGSPPDRFAAYERQIRQEYAWVPEPEFREHRGRFLRAMLGRTSIFHVPEMRERHEAHARRNLEASLRQLGSPA